MRHIEQPSRGKGHRTTVIWLLLAALTGIALAVGPLGPAAQARDGLSTRPHTAQHDPAEASASSTRFLPLVFHSRDVPESALGIQLFGVNSDMVDSVYHAGASWIRIPLCWSRIEPQNTTPQYYQWPEDFDRQLLRLTARGIRIILTLKDNPSWAATYPSGPIDRVNISELAEFMQAAVAHYGGDPYYVKHWEMYNEPDNTSAWHAANGGWGYFGRDPGAYVDMLAAVYGPMKAADPAAQVVFGGIAHDNWTCEGGPFAEEFVDGVLRHGGGSFFDVMNFHYYIAFCHKWDPYGPGIIGKATALRQKLASYGVYKPLICTETSMWSDALHGGSEEAQSRYVAKVFARSMAADLGATIWFMLSEDRDAEAFKYGLLDADLNPKPAYFAYQAMSQQLAATRYVRTLSPAETGSEQVEAYQFATANGSTSIVVAWTNDEAAHTIALAADQITEVDKFGSARTILDCDDGATDGLVQVVIGPSPVFLRLTL